MVWFLWKLQNLLNKVALRILGLNASFSNYLIKIIQGTGGQNNRYFWLLIFCLLVKMNLCFSTNVSIKKITETCQKFCYNVRSGNTIKNNPLFFGAKRWKIFGPCKIVKENLRRTSLVFFAKTARREYSWQYPLIGSRIRNR